MTQHPDLESVVAPEVAAAEDAVAQVAPSRSRWSELRTSVTLYTSVAVGSVLGAVMRALVSLAYLQGFGPGFPWGTLFVNVTGSLVIGFYAALTAPDGRLFAGARQRQLVMTGMCGGYTSFSAFSLETYQFIHAGNLPAAGLYVGASIFSWLAAVWLGHMFASRLNRLRRS